MGYSDSVIYMQAMQLFEQMFVVSNTDNFKISHVCILS